jgi:hypothetical protein
MRKRSFPWHWIVLALLPIVCVALWILGSGKISIMRNAEEPQNNQSWEEMFDENMRKPELPQWNTPIEGSSPVRQGTDVTIDKAALGERGPAIFDEKLHIYADYSTGRRWTVGEITERWWQEEAEPFEAPSLTLKQLFGTGSNALDPAMKGVLKMNRDFSAVYTTLRNETATGSWSVTNIQENQPSSEYSLLRITFSGGNFLLFNINSQMKKDVTPESYTDLSLYATETDHPDYMILNLDDYNKIALRLDKASFRRIGDNYFRDAFTVYFNGTHGEVLRLPTRKPSSFRILSETFAADSERVYAIVPGYEWISLGEVKGADPATFKVLSPELGKDDNHVYFYTNRIEGADPVTFAMVKGYEEYFSQDKNHLYLIDVPLENIQPSSFSIAEVMKEEESDSTDFVKWTITDNAGKHAIVRLECGGPSCYYPEIFVIVPVDPDAKKLTYQGMDESGSGMIFLLDDDQFRYSAVIDAKGAEEEYYRISVNQPTNIRREPLPAK